MLSVVLYREVHSVWLPLFFFFFLLFILHWIIAD